MAFLPEPAPLIVTLTLDAASQAAFDALRIAHFPPAETVLRRIAAVEAFDLAAQAGAIEHPACVIATRDDVLVPSTC